MQPSIKSKIFWRESSNEGIILTIILSSGYAEEDATKKFLDSNLTGFIQKPYQGNTLLAILQKYLK